MERFRAVGGVKPQKQGYHGHKESDYCKIDIVGLTVGRGKAQGIDILIASGRIRVHALLGHTAQTLVGAAGGIEGLP